MGHALRYDFPWAWHHVFNRGLAHRAICESAIDALRFEELLADVVERGLIEVHAYCLMSTHFHLLVRSVDGRLSQAMQLLASRYSRSFNRGRDRDGPLIRGRFRSKVVDDDDYWLTVLRYIDLNPVGVLCDLPSDYPHGSAYHYRRGGGPNWLTRDRVAAAVLRGGAWDGGPLPDYDRFATFTAPETVRELVRRRRSATSTTGSAARGSPASHRRWLEAAARLADGTVSAGFHAPTAPVLRAVAARRRRLPQARGGKSVRHSVRRFRERGVIRA